MHRIGTRAPAILAGASVCLAVLALGGCGADEAEAELRRIVGHWVMDTGASWERTRETVALGLPLPDDLAASFGQTFGGTLEVTRSGAVELKDQRGYAWVGAVEDTGAELMVTFEIDDGQLAAGRARPLRVSAVLEPIEGGILMRVTSVGGLGDGAQDLVRAFQLVSALVMPRFVFRPLPEGER